MITVKIGKYIKEPARPKNVWAVEHQQMSGDADAYNDYSKGFSDYDEMITYLTILLAIVKIQSNGYGTNVAYVEKELKKVLTPELYAKEIEKSDFVSEVCGYDVTCQGCLAAAQDPDVFWYDADGVKYECNIEMSNE